LAHYGIETWNLIQFRWPEFVAQVGFQTIPSESLGIVSTPTWRRHPHRPRFHHAASPIHGPDATPSPSTPQRRPLSSMCRGGPAAPPSSTCKGGPAAPRPRPGRSILIRATVCILSVARCHHVKDVFILRARDGNPVRKRCSSTVGTCLGGAARHHTEKLEGWVRSIPAWVERRGTKQF
jgi:hypothetical protein